MRDETGFTVTPSQIADQRARLGAGAVGTSNARVDMRGLTLVIELNSVRFEHVDFSSMRFASAGSLLFVDCRDCLFDHADLRSHNVNGEFRGCSFKSARLGSIARRFEECDFQGADLVGAVASQVIFDRCSFRGSVLRRANLYDCVFINCDWTDASFARGSIAGSRFEGTAPALDQLGNTIVDDVTGLHSKPE